MELIAFRVSMYKGIIDFGWVDVNNLTVLVGKNESGKTSLLKALHKLNPDSGDSYDIEKEWPRTRRKERKPEHVVCQARFRLSDREKSHLSRSTSVENFPDIVEVSRNYAGELEVKFEGNIFPGDSQTPDLNKLFDALPKIQDAFGVEFKRRADKCLRDAIRLAQEKKYDALREIAGNQELYLSEGLSPSPSRRDIEIDFIRQYRQTFQNLIQELEQLPDIQVRADRYVTSRLPKFIYMNDYRIFSGTARLDEIQSRQREDELTEVDKTFLTILDLSELDLDELVQLGKGDEGKKAQRNYDLHNGATTLTEAFSNHLSQRGYEIEYRVDGHLFFVFLKDNLNPAPIELEERSRGFQWFFSFDLSFMHGTKNTFKGSVILLDEPGLHLHPEAQENLLARFEEYAKQNTILYTTHLPFMIDMNHPARIRILKETKEGIRVDTDFTDPTSKSHLVLEAALGMKAAQNYLVGQRNLVVEGYDDYWILTELSNLLQRSGLEGLPEDIHITPGGGASRAVYIATFMIGQDLRVVALFDSDKEGRREQKNLTHNWITQCTEPRAEAILLGDAAGVPGDFAIEDLFPEDFVTDIVKEFHSEALANAGIAKIQLRGKDILWRRIERFMKENGIEINKGPIVKRLCYKLSDMKDASELPDGTQEKAIKLFQAIRKAFREMDAPF